MGINEIIMWIMMTFMVIAALDRMMAQFGGSETVLGKVGLGSLGRQISGAGSQFEEGFMAMGALGLAMVGVIALAPVLAHWLGPVVIPLYEAVGASPAMFATTLLANDMGGFFLAKQLSGGDTAAWLYAGLILGAMMGPTIVFNIPVALGIIDKADRRFLALGVMAGMVTIPLGCLAGGVTAMLSDVSVNGQPVVFTLPMLLVNMIPVIVVAVLLAVGLKLCPEKMIAGFQVFAKCLVVLITAGLALAVLQATLGVALVPGMDPIFTARGDEPGTMRAIEVIGFIACVLLGAYPMVFILTRWFEKPLMRVGGLLGMNNSAAAGMVATLANSIPMFGLMSKMDDRGKVINVAFAVSAAFTFGDHLGFTAANVSSMIFPMIVGKLVGGVSAVLLAMRLAPAAQQD
ncbi:ethanolamine utilization protein EutH [Paludibacterium paludis]|uniref:Ethanolamine utilization protein EutH n=1 Tax=Paludibacterium paludis TaxID=1225769 RepID=A0A918NX66_9NEIS|nr:ethanolamine utilization protein EutH [Paludibacterium paludis]GGY02268.1 ethanolamine utilization protein EutH [Paludibacterium paludis]